MKKRIGAIAALAAIALLGPSIASAADAPYAALKWRNIGPAIAGGRVAGVAGTDQDPNLYYLATAGGGVWKSANGGATWKAVFNNQAVSAIGAVAIDPRNDNVVWAGTGEANPRNDVSYGDGLYKTTDGGKHWKRVGLALTRSISRIAIDPKNPNHVVVGAFGDPFKDSTHRGVYVTFNGGKTWSKSLYVGPMSGASDIAMNPQNPSVVYAGIWQFRRKPWTFTSGGPQDGLYKSTDGGRKWKRVTGNGFPTGYTGRIGLAIAPSNPNRVYALIEAKGGILWRSDDAGAHWKMMSNDTLVDQRPFYFTHIAVDPKNENHVYAVSEMLSESKDGGKKFKEIAKSVHVDYHAIWIAPNNPSRIITGEDGGYALTLDNGKHWSFSRNLTIGEVYHVGLSNENPYTICAPLQDNNGFCGPSNSLDNEGILDRHWTDVVGGDGEWSVPDPIDPNYIWSDLENGVILVFNKQTQSSRFVMPYNAFPGSFLGPFDLSKAKYRFNWDSPIAFAPWDGHIGWFGSDVVFQTTDRGEHWTAISPDLTRNIKAHQQPSGGPLAKDVSGAEYSDTILYIEGSQLDKGEIWVGTDDGLVQMTRDGGTTWNKVTPPGVPEYARVEATSPSPLVAGTAYVSADNHRLGDYAPYAFVTHDYGKTWAKIVTGLPHDQYVRTIRPDIRNPNVVYAGTENGLWISFDQGAHWQNFRNNLPQVSVRDIRLQPQFDDIVLATHGRGVWVLDDASSIQQLAEAQKAGVMLFKPRTSYEYHYHSNDEGIYTRYSGANPPNGAIVDFYQAKPQAKAPVVQILDAKGAVIRTIMGTHKVKDKNVPFVTNKAGINRFVWDFHETGPTLWMGAAREKYRGPKVGALAVPGTYTVRMTLDGKTLEQSFEVKPDPRDHWTQADYQAGFDFATTYLAKYGKIDDVLNHLDTIGKSLNAAAVAAKGDASLAAQVTKAQAQRNAVFSAFTADYKNDEDSIQRPGSLRESVPRTGFGEQQPPTAATLTYAAEFDTAYTAAFAKYNAFVQSLSGLSSELHAKGKKPVAGAITITP
ncbi:MAG TPA: hypothetical protein VMW12_06375 [Candidatus Dormibacteraeota bacterium]|nr:hypothetical protein [Candidatus Dormibacteraeota bacterium]